MLCQQSVDLSRGQVIDHVYHTRIAKRIATLARRVTQCSKKMRLSRSGRPDQHGTAVRWIKSQSKSRRIAALGIRLGKLKSYSARVFGLGSALGTVAAGATVGGPSAPGRSTWPGPPAWVSLTSRLIQHFTVALGDLRKVRFGQVAAQPCLYIVVTSCHESSPRCPCRDGRKWRDRRALIRSHRSIRAAGEWAEWAWEAVAAAVPPTASSRHRRRRRSPAPRLGDGGKHLRRPVESCQAQQATQVDAGLHWLTLEVEVELACLGPQRIELLFQRGSPRPPGSVSAAGCG